MIRDWGVLLPAYCFVIQVKILPGFHPPLVDERFQIQTSPVLSTPRGSIRSNLTSFSA
jgi:hypothetical protein